MSRKRRSTTSAQTLPAAQPASSRKPTAAYIRLSNESNNEKSEDSIQNQTQLVHQFIQNRPDLQLMDTYVDCGYSGTNFERPEFIRLLEDAKRGRVTCIVVKDLSRFGRNYIEAGYYIENLFQRLNIQFIAITDDFDNTRPNDLNGLETPFKNMINDFYAKDVSRKNCLTAQIQRSSGNKVPRGTAPYGYRFSPDKTHYIPDEKTAPFVRLIFQWTAQGMGPAEIIRRLNLLHAITPGQYRMQTAGRGEAPSGAAWTTSTIQRILNQPMYQGNVVFGRTRAELYRGIPPHKTEESQWTVYENTHEPLVTPEDYRKARQMIEKRSRSNGFVKHRKSQTRHRYSGKVICMCCGKKMGYRGIPDRKGFLIGTYRCPNRCVEDIHEDRIRSMICDRLRGLTAPENAREFGQQAMDFCKQPQSLDELEKQLVESIGIGKNQKVEIRLGCGDVVQDPQHRIAGSEG